MIRENALSLSLSFVVYLLLLSVIKCFEFVRILVQFKTSFFLVLKRTTRNSFNDDDDVMITIVVSQILVLFLKQWFSLVRKRCFCLCR